MAFSPNITYTFVRQDSSIMLSFVFCFCCSQNSRTATATYTFIGKNALNFN